MELPPGPKYLLEVFPWFALPSLITYSVLYLLEKTNTNFNVPFWATFFLVVSARPIIVIFNYYYSIWQNNRAALANNAVLPPSVPKSMLSIVSEFTQSKENRYPGGVFLRFTEDYGSIVRFNVLTDASLITDEPEHVKAILATQFDSFHKGSVFYSQAHSLLGEGVFNSDGEMFHRAMTRPFFTRERITDFDIYDRNWSISLKTAKARLNEGFSLDIQDLISRFTLDSATEFLFGGEVGSLSAGIPYPPGHEKANSPVFYNHPSTSFVKAFTKGLSIVAERGNFGKEWALVEFNSDQVTPLRQIIDDFTEPLLSKALHARSNGTNLKTNEEVTLLEHLVKHTQDTKILKDELVNLLVAGRDTTMCLLTFAVYMLAEHPDIEKRLREEIYDKVGATEAPTYEKMREMRYMKAFLNEVLRLYPPVPSNGRTTTKPVLLPAIRPGEKPFYIPKDTTCIYAVINIHRRKDLWGPDGKFYPLRTLEYDLNTLFTALEFDPDRFLDDRVKKYLVANPYIFCPFNAGPRICLGQQFAYNEASFYLIRLLQNFTEFTLDNSVNIPPPAQWKFRDSLTAKEKIFPTAHLTLFVKGGLWVKMKSLDNEQV
ncbi:Cytochrome P450 monooxygenase 75 [Psilocybe cubensis]|uniref:Cytochrome P450 monooxygenase 75 n=2 Tax=Psilocybe cubensis TaxID=181762 RepID=A0ACB8GQ52_PSICU|nr:Cytochrome P450 monooxygenase 75 [Psilocybe cubensis]KAH9477758.1 Cytochrome P450 monooxygenase 75 [Psilocybe cubensis]